MTDREYGWQRAVKITYRVHALVQMFRRKISPDDVLSIMRNGTIVEEYPEDTPYPGVLLTGRINRRPIHVVVAYNDVERRQL